MYQFPSSLKLNDIPLHVLLHLVHLSIDTWFVYIFCLLWIVLLLTRVYNYLSRTLLSIWGVYTQKLLDHMIILFLSFWGASKLFSIVTVLFYMWSMYIFFICNSFIGFWLHYVFVAVWGLSPVVESGGYAWLWCTGFSLWWLLLWGMDSRRSGFSSCCIGAHELWLEGSRERAQ